ncbi:FG-GAP-like repeat-containing protein, partial [Microcoleus sp. B13-B4]
MSTFSSATNFPVGTNPQSLTAENFNNDNIPDLAIGGTAVSMLIGNSQGGFDTPANVNQSSSYTPIVAGIFNNDNFLDLALTSWSGGEFPNGYVYILPGTGQGTFGNSISFSAGENRLSAIGVGDFNADNLSDIVVADVNGRVVIGLKNAQGNFFTPEYTSQVGTNPTAIAARDFNGDGSLDLAITSSASNNVSILLNTGGAGADRFSIPVNYAVGTNPTSIAAEDFNGDNILDLAITNSVSNNISILLGTGQGAFANATNYAAGGDSPTSIAVADLNADSKLDIAVANNQSNNVSILVGTGQGTFNNPINYAVGTNPKAIAIKDFNADNKPDLATANSGSNDVSILLNTTVEVNFGAATYSGTEGTTDTIVNVPVTISGGTPFSDLVVPIVIDPSSTATQDSDYTFSPATLTFPAGTNTLTQNVAVTVKADNIAENAETAVFSFGTITDGIAGTTKETTLTIPANDAIDYAIAVGTASLTEGNSGTTPVTFTVTRSGGIDAASSVNYAIGGTATNSSDYNNIGGTSGGTSITGTVNFAAGETSKTLTLDVLGDAIIEPDETITVTLSNPVAPGPTPTITAATATTTIGNDDTAGVTVNPASGLVTTEAGDSATFTVKLNSQPSANVSIDLSSSNPAEGTVSSNSLTFTPANWNELQTVKLTGVDDSIADGSKTYNIVTAATVSTDINYSNLNPDDVSASNSDNETPGITINPASTTATEGGATGSYTVQLNSQPIAPVTINLATGSQIQPITALTFTANNWNVAQTVAVAAVDDNAVEGNHAGAIAHTATSTDTNYNSITIGAVSVAITDNDTAGFSIAPTNITATEGGANGSYKIQLTSEPKAPVTISFNTDNQLNPIATPLTFDNTNWNVAQTVTVTALDDNVAQGTHSGTIAHTATSTDANYNAKVIPNVTASITDNDSPGISIVQSAGSTNIAEGGATATYGVVLTSAPAANVTINFDTGTQISVIAPVTFTPNNWNVAQNVTVSAIDDSIAQGTRSGTIAHTSVSTDIKYNNLTISPVTATIADNDTTGVSISPESTTATEGGATGSFTLKLNSQPTAPVT